LENDPQIGKITCEKPETAYKVILHYHKDIVFTINEMNIPEFSGEEQPNRKRLGWEVYTIEGEDNTHTLYQWTEKDWEHGFQNSVSFNIPWEKVVDLSKPGSTDEFFVVYVDVFTICD
jgi:hypothetical protein